MDPATLLLAEKGSSFGIRVALAQARSSLSDQRKLDEAWREIVDELVIECCRRLDLIEARFGRLDDQVPEDEAKRVFFAAQLEAARSPTKERVRMLGGALGAYFRPDLDLDLKRRVFRRLHEIEPGDQLRLAEHARNLGDAERYQLQTGRGPGPRTHVSADDALVAAGVITLSAPNILTHDLYDREGNLIEWVTVTPLGRAVLKFLENLIPPVHP